VEVEDGGELGQLAQTVRGPPEVLSPSFREYALRAADSNDATQFLVQACRGAQQSDGGFGRRLEAASLTFQTIQVEGDEATAVVEWRTRSESFRTCGNDTRYSLRRSGGKWEVVAKEILMRI
jgi:hypothetical protein